MNMFLMGGWMMWPLGAVSIIAAAIVIERILFFSACSFPSRDFSIALEKAISGDITSLMNECKKQPLFHRFAEILADSSLTMAQKEAALRIEGEAVVSKMEKYLSLLSILARLAPLMGLLGTVLGMIATFSEIANATAGVNMNQLAGGIWQALITTAAGLCIAIPALFFLHHFQERVSSASSALSEAANAILSQSGDL